MRYSRQRELVLDAVRSSSHPSAEEVYQSIKDRGEEVSIATVYRNLSALAENGTILRLTVPGSSDRFDIAEVDHGHMVCTCCGKVSDVKLEGLEDFLASRTADSGCRITEHEIVLRVLCKDCIKNNESGEIS